MRIISKTKLLIAASIVATTGIITTTPAMAWDIVYDPTAVAKQIAIYNNAVQQLQQQVNQYNNAIQNTRGLSQQYWGNTRNDILQLNKIMQQTSAINSQMSNMDEMFSSKYPGYENYATNGVSVQNKLAQWRNDTSSSSLAALKTLGVASNQMQSEEALLQQLETLGNSAEGRMQAAQVANMWAAQAVRQTQKLREIQMLQVQLQAQAQAQQADKEAAAAVAMAQLESTLNATPTDKTYRAYTGEIE